MTATTPAPAAATATATPPPPAQEQQQQQSKGAQHEREVEEREAYEYWGYLFKPDKTGADKLKSLLRGLKQTMNEHFTNEPATDIQPDLTPDQLAHFYRELHGNYDQLFLGTPSESIAFIYKSLGCLHSLQPQSFSHSKAFTDPTVPALKTEGWIMWQTIQLLLGPDEHCGFMMEAVQKWDVKDPVTGETFPKLLPRSCFPAEPDRHMVAWYEGVSERLRKEADEEEEEKGREGEAEKAEVRRVKQAPALAPEQEEGRLTDDEESMDSRGPALAYFRNPLYRHVDGRPSIVRRNSKRPGLSPRPTFRDKGKEAAIAAGHVIRNIGSPHLWDGKSSRHVSRERHGDSRDRRRRSLPDHRNPSGPHHHTAETTPTSAGAHDSGSGLSPHEARHRRRRSSQQPQPEGGRPMTAGSAAGDYEASDADESSMYASPPPRPSPHHHHGHHHHKPSHSKHDAKESPLRQTRSHEPTPTYQQEHGDYFTGYDDEEQDQHHNASHNESTPGTPPVVSGFGPSASPLFATHVARKPQQPAITGAPAHSRRVEPADPYIMPPRKDPSVRRAQEQDRRPYSRSPADPDLRHDRREDPRRYESPRRARFEQSPAGYEDEDLAPHHRHAPPFPPAPGPEGRHPPRRSFDLPPPQREPYLAQDLPRMPPHGRRPDRRERLSGSEVGGPFPDDRRQGRPKMTRFDGPDGRGGPPVGPPDGRSRRAVSRGVDGRRYVDGSPWGH